MELETSFASERCFTQAEFARWSETHERDLERCELLNGRIVITPIGGWPQGQASALVGARIFQVVDPLSLGRVFGSGQGFELPSGDTVGPDGAYVSNERWEAAPAPEPGKFLRMVPDLVVEIVSRSTASRDRGEKKAIYERNGVLEYVLVDCLGRRVLRFALRDGRYGLPDEAAEGDALESSVVPGLRLTVDQLIPT